MAKQPNTDRKYRHGISKQFLVCPWEQTITDMRLQSIS
jgi:hypothetical protein